MTSDDLHVDRAIRLMAQVGRQLRWLDRLCRRMDQLGFPPDDSLRQAALAARSTMQDLHVEAHYASCKSGVGRDTL